MIFEKQHRVDFTAVPGTPFIVLTNDRNLTPKALERRTIALETEIADLPEVRALGPHDIVFDVGAFIGDTALIFAQSRATVIAFEPQFDAFFCAKWNLSGYPNVTVINSPVGSSQRVMANQDPMAGNLGTRTVTAAANGTATAAALDSLALPAPTFIKIDVEGFEPAVINGAFRMLMTHRPVLLIEIYPELLARNAWTPADVTEPLKALGYRLREAIGNSSEPRWDIIATYENDPNG